MDIDEETRQSSNSAPLVERSGDRRRRSRFHLPERRTGFDRRRAYFLTGALRDKPVALLGVLFVTNVLSTLDFFLTYLQLDAGAATEANPVLAGLFVQGPGAAWLFKTTVMLAVSIVIWRSRRLRGVLMVAVIALVSYVAVILYHFAGMRLTGML